jgi:tRNA1Val (adenine37-N6)-methyltransferase
MRTRGVSATLRDVPSAERATLFAGRLALAQPARGDGYRVNVDALLLADFARRAPRAATTFDLGAGVGAISLALLHWGATERVTLIEIDPHAAELARANLEANGWSGRAEVVTGDVTRLAEDHAGAARLVVCNPPYFAPGRGRPATGASRSRARSGELGAFVAAARVVLGRRGRACFIYPARELATLLETFRRAGLEPKRMRLVRSRSEEPARVAMVEAAAAKAGGLLVEPDCVERAGDGPSEEVKRIVAGE